MKINNLQDPNADDISRIEALERNLMSLERFVHDLQRDLQDIKKALAKGVGT